MKFVNFYTHTKFNKEVMHIKDLIKIKCIKNISKCTVSKINTTILTY